MILPIVPELNRRRIVLASGSPRRLSLLRLLGLNNIEQRPSSYGEDVPKDSCTSCAEYVLRTARGKAADVVQALEAAAAERPLDLVIAADTIVSLPGSSLNIIEKASSAADAKAMLTRLSGRTHQVWSGVIIAYRSAQDGAVAFKEFAVCTEVRVAELSDALLDAYVANSANWRGKAGAYGIQDIASCFIESICGDFYNVMGLPLQRVCAELMKLHESGELAPDGTS